MSDTTGSDVGVPAAPAADAPAKTYDASCHCGAFNICVCNGYLFIYVPNERVVFSNGGIEQFKSYSFASKKMAHYFCDTCGASCMARSKDPDFFPGMTCVNARMLRGVELEKLKRKFGDGKNY